MNTENYIKDKELKCNRFKINCIWIICILAILLVFSIAFISSSRIIDGSCLCKYLSFASVLLSVVLSVFAIMFTYTSNASIEQRFNRIDEISKDLEKATKLMANTSEKLNNNIVEILAKIRDVSDKLNENDRTTDYSSAAGNNLSVSGNEISKDVEPSKAQNDN